MKQPPPSAREVWELALPAVQARLNRPAIRNWLKTVEPISLEGNVLTLAVSTEFARDWLERRAGDQIRACVSQALGEPAQVEMVLSQLDLDLSVARARSAPPPRETRTLEARCLTPLHPRYTFEDFVVGRGNQFAQAAALARITGADKWPQLSASFKGARQKNIIVGIPIPGDKVIHNNSFGVSLDALWEIDLWGRINKAETAALAGVEASWADLSGARLSIAAQTAKAWFAVTEAGQQAELAEQAVESFRTSADYVRRRYQQGVRSSLDVRLALANLAAAEALLELRREQLDRAKRQLEILLGRYPAAAIEAPAEGSRKQKARAMTQQFANLVERYVRAYPRQWGVFHKVWGEARDDRKPAGAVEDDAHNGDE